MSNKEGNQSFPLGLLLFESEITVGIVSVSCLPKGHHPLELIRFLKYFKIFELENPISLGSFIMCVLAHLNPKEQFIVSKTALGGKNHIKPQFKFPERTLMDFPTQAEIKLQCMNYFLLRIKIPVKEE